MGWINLEDLRFLCEEFDGDMTDAHVSVVRVSVAFLAHSSHSVGTIVLDALS